MATVIEPEKKVFQDGTSDDAVLEQLGYTQGTCLSHHMIQSVNVG